MPFHNVHSPKNDSTGQKGIGDLVKDGILRHVIVDGDPQGQGDESYGNQRLDELGPPVCERGVGHDAGGVNHGQLIGQLHGVLDDGSCCQQDGTTKTWCERGGNGSELVTNTRELRETPWNRVQPQCSPDRTGRRRRHVRNADNP